jgi:hypothetical protein
MKKILLAIVFTTIVFTLVSCEGSYIVTSQPVAPYYVRPIAPGPGYIWIDGDWMFEGGTYVWHEGYWGLPRGRRNWQAGHWENRNNGWHWHRGGWH